MKLSELLKTIQPVQVTGSTEKDITGVNIDSRLVAAGHLFMAMRGTQTDGHAYIPAAIEKGAIAVLCEDMPEEPTPNITYIQVKDSENAVGKVATAFYGDPTSKMELVGVTGTNGKTTIATLLYNTFRHFGYKVGLISTVCNYIDDRAIPTEHTTPDPITLNRLLGEMADSGCKYAFMEVSSHSIAQQRISGLKFAGGIFTNLTRDHLDYHKTVENYLKAKKKFFDDMPKNAFSLTNLDDKNGLVMTQNTRSRVYTYSLRSLSDFKGKILESHFEGMLLDFNNRELAVRFIGKFNAYNLLAVFGAAVLLGKKEEDVLIALSTLHPVAGRFDSIRSPKGITAIVDYAHTPDALVNVLNAIHDVLEGKGKVITVVGAGGNRFDGQPVVKMNVGHDRDGRGVHDLGQGIRRGLIRHGEADDLAPGVMQPGNLLDGRARVRGVRVAHGLHRDRGAAAHRNGTHHHLAGQLVRLGCAAHGAPFCGSFRCRV